MTRVLAFALAIGSAGAALVAAADAAARWWLLG